MVPVTHARRRARPCGTPQGVTHTQRSPVNWRRQRTRGDTSMCRHASGEINGVHMKDNLSFQRYSNKAALPDGTYSIRVTFKGLPERVYTLRIVSGTCIIPFTIRLTNGAEETTSLILEPYAIVKDGIVADYRISESLPSPYHALTTNDSILGNLTAPKLVWSKDQFGFIVNNV